MVVTDYNEQFLDKRGTDHLIEELKAYVDGIVNGNIDLSNYVTKEELQAKLDALHINIDLSAYATKEELTNAINSIVSSYALKTEIPNKVSELENDSGYLTEHQDLSDYARTADLHSHTNKNVLDDISATDVSNWNDAKVHSQTPHAPSTAQPNFIEDIKVNGASLMISDKTVNIDLSKYAKKTDIPSTDGLATTKYVDNAIANIPTGGDVDLSNYYTKEETNALIPSTEGLATETYVNNAISNIPTTDLSNYYTKNETYSKTEVDTLVANSGGSGGGGSSSGGASGITYAYDTEIATGDTWIDGKPIYLKVFHIDALTTKPKDIFMKSYYEQDIFADQIVSVNTIWKLTNSNGDTYIDGNSVISPSNVNTSSSYVGGNVNDFIIGRENWVKVNNFNQKSTPTFSITVARGTGHYNYSCDVIMKYTKI